MDILKMPERLNLALTSEKKEIEELEKQLERLIHIKSTREISDKYSKGSAAKTSQMEDADVEGTPLGGSMKEKYCLIS